MAYEAYLRGRQAFNRWSRRGFTDAIAFFTEAGQRDPEYAWAHAWLAHAYSGAAFFGYVEPARACPEARKAALRAANLDPANPEARLALAWIRFAYDWDWEGAGEGLRKALSLGPNSPTAHWGYAWYLTGMGRHEEALAEIQRALELDPFNPVMNTSYGDMLRLARRPEDALRQYDKTLELAPQFAWAYELKAHVYASLARYGEAFAAHEKYLESTGSGPGRIMTAEVRSAADRVSYWTWTLRRLLEEEGETNNPPVMDLARTYVHMNEKDRAFGWLEKAYEMRLGGLTLLRVDPDWDPIRSDPRFAPLLRRMRFPAVGGGAASADPLPAVPSGFYRRELQRGVAPAVASSASAP